MHITEVRDKDFQRLVTQKQIYVDYTGGGQCPETVLNQYHELLLNTTFGNPHSYNPTASATTKLVEAARSRVLKEFDGTEDYDVVFTQNASGALKIFGESFPFTSNSTLILARDNHNSVMGIREYAKRAGAKLVYWELDNELRLLPNLEELLKAEQGREVVVAFPAQSNFSGVMHPLSYVELAHQYGATVLLDTAAYVPTHPFSLKQTQPDACCISFYKILGFPTGLGALLIKKTVLAKLKKAWFAGGTVRGVSLEDYVLEPNFSSFEDGTINYALIPTLPFVFDYIQSVGGFKAIEEHVTTLTTTALSALSAIPSVKIYGPTTMDHHGATIAFNILTSTGTPLHYTQVERQAYDLNISLRGGCFCNPGSGSKAFGLDRELMQRYLVELKSHTKEEANVPGAVRISFGIANNEADVTAVTDFIRHLANVPERAILSKLWNASTHSQST